MKNDIDFTKKKVEQTLQLAADEATNRVELKMKHATKVGETILKTADEANKKVDTNVKKAINEANKKVEDSVNYANKVEQGQKLI